MTPYRSRYVMAGEAPPEEEFLGVYDDGLSASQAQPYSFLGTEQDIPQNFVPFSPTVAPVSPASSSPYGLYEDTANAYDISFKTQEQSMQEQLLTYQNKLEQPREVPTVNDSESWAMALGAAVPLLLGATGGSTGMIAGGAMSAAMGQNAQEFIGKKQQQLFNQQNQDRQFIQSQYQNTATNLQQLKEKHQMELLSLREKKASADQQVETAKELYGVYYPNGRGGGGNEPKDTRTSFQKDYQFKKELAEKAPKQVIGGREYEVDPDYYGEPPTGNYRGDTIKKMNAGGNIITLAERLRNSITENNNIATSKLTSFEKDQRLTEQVYGVAQLITRLREYRGFGANFSKNEQALLERVTGFDFEGIPEGQEMSVDNVASIIKNQFKVGMKQTDTYMKLGMLADDVRVETDELSRVIGLRPRINTQSDGEGVTVNKQVSRPLEDLKAKASSILGRKPDPTGESSADRLKRLRGM